MNNNCNPYNNSTQFIRVDDWIEFPKDRIVTVKQNSLRIDFGNYKIPDPDINWEGFQNFTLASQKRCYNNPEIKHKISKYINYFLKFYDVEKELLFSYTKLKYEIDIRPLKTGVALSFEDFVKLLKKYILNEEIYAKLGRMNEDNYMLSLQYENKNNRALQYNDTHGKYFMEISVMQNFIIPVIMHYFFTNNIRSNVEEYILQIYNILLDRYQDVDIISKLYETTYTTTHNDMKHNGKLWEKSKIRGITGLTSSLDELNICLIQVMPKYLYNSNMIMYNFKSFRNMIGYSVTEISYEYDLISLSASKRDGEDNASQMDKYEANQARKSESLKIENTFNAKHTMHTIMHMYGPFYKEEIEFFRKRLSSGGNTVVMNFQKNLVSLPLMKLFGNASALNSINVNDYLIMLLSTRNLLLANEMKLLPMILSSKVIKISTRNNINKKEKMKIECSENYELILQKYSSSKDRVFKAILNIIATIMASEFEVISYFEPELDGQRIHVDSDFLIDEILRYCLLI